MTARPLAAPEKLLTSKQVAELLGVHVKTVHRYRKILKLPCVRLGKAVRFRGDQVVRWLNSQSEEGQKS